MWDKWRHFSPLCGGTNAKFMAAADRGGWTSVSRARSRRRRPASRDPTVRCGDEEPTRSARWRTAVGGISTTRAGRFLLATRTIWNADVDPSLVPDIAVLPVVPSRSARHLQHLRRIRPGRAAIDGGPLLATSGSGPLPASDEALLDMEVEPAGDRGPWMLPGLGDDVRHRRRDHRVGDGLAPVEAEPYHRGILEQTTHA